MNQNFLFVQKVPTFCARFSLFNFFDQKIDFGISVLRRKNDEAIKNASLSFLVLLLLNVFLMYFVLAIYTKSFFAMVKWHFL